MERYISTIRKEMATSGDVNVVQFKLGAFNNASDRDAFKMAVALRHDNGSTSNDTVPQYTADVKDARGTPLRDLHLELFDAIVGQRTGTVYVGKGSRTYDYLGKVMPDGLVGWMLALKSRKNAAQGAVKEEERVDGGGSPGWERVDQVSEEESA